MKKITIILSLICCHCYLSAQEDNQMFANLNSENIWETLDKEHLSVNLENIAITTQLGDNNLIIRQAEIDASKFSQNGDGNQLYLTNYYSGGEPTNMTGRINGDNNYVEILGVNSVADNLQINITGNDKTVIVRNYN